MNLKGYLNYLKLSGKIIVSLFFFVISFSEISAQESIDSTKFVMQKSPLSAVLQSAVLPGLGQIYNESYWKAPVFWSILGYFTYEWIDNNNKYKDYRTLFTNSQNVSPEGNRGYLSLREFYRDQRDQFAVYIGITYFLNLVDAYVDAHLFDFNVEDDFGSKKFNLSLKVPLK
ncbi:hypothetical protein APF79_07080 [bacterium BRH_c32]|nr:MAG: hypothetical protein APF79_07080 [bacterium BRH_c32]